MTLLERTAASLTEALAALRVIAERGDPVSAGLAREALERIHAIATGKRRPES